MQVNSKGEIEAEGRRGVENVRVQAHVLDGRRQGAVRRYVQVQSFVRATGMHTGGLSIIDAFRCSRYRLEVCATRVDEVLKHPLPVFAGVP